jgi:hypothetical protein
MIQQEFRIQFNEQSILDKLGPMEGGIFIEQI